MVVMTFSISSHRSAAVNNRYFRYHLVLCCRTLEQLFQCLPSICLTENCIPYQIFLRQILVQNNFDTSGLQTPELAQQLQGLNEVLKYSIIVCIQCASDVSVSVRTEAFL